MVVSQLAKLIHAREDALRLFLCVLAGYPLAFFHRSVVYKKPVPLQHAFFVAVGVALYLFNCGYDIIHTLVAIALAFLITNFMTGTVGSVVAAHVVFLGYLLVAYWFEESDGYDISWTTPFCVLVLRMIGLVMNVYDGVHYEKLKSDQKKVAIKELPCLLEIASFAFFYTGTFVGPQFTLVKFRSYMRGDWLDEKRQPRESAKKEALNRFVTGCVYAVVNLWGTSFIPNSYFNSPEFYQQSFFWRWTWTVIWCRIVTCRYCAMWQLVEGAAILNGLGFNGRDERGEVRWDGVRDLDPWKWETAHDFTLCIQAFNRGTNSWAKNNILRRLRWLNNKPLAHMITLGYLAIWHGYHLGYFLLFGFEFGCVMAQQQLYSLIKQSPAWARFNMQPAVRPLVLLFGRLVVLYSTSFAFLTFGLVKTRNWIGPIKSLYFVGYIFYFVIWPLLHKLLLSVLDIDKKSRARSPTTSEFTTKTVSERSRTSL